MILREERRLKELWAESQNFKKKGKNMELVKKAKHERLGEVQELYNRAALGVSAKKEDFKKFEAQYRGDHSIDAKKKNDEGEATDAPQSASVVWNISFELLEASIDTNIPQPFVTPEFQCEHHVRNARRIENLIKMLLDKKPFENYNDSQERTVKKLGSAGMNLEWDIDVGTHTTVGEVDVTPLRPQNIYPQPGLVDINGCDYVFINYLTTRSELMRRYSLTQDDVEGTEFDPTYEIETQETDSAHPASDEDVVTLTVMWYRNSKGDICRFAYSGDLVLEDDDDYYSRKVEYCKTCGRRRQICEKDECNKPNYFMNKLDYEELDEDLICSDGRIIPAYSPVFKNGKPVFETVRMPVTAPDGTQMLEDVGGIEMPAFMEVQVPKMEKTRLPYYKPKRLPIAMRYNIRDDDSFWGISDMEIIREDQQECNKLTSRIHEAIMKSGAVIMKPEEVDLVLTNELFEGSIDLPRNADQRQFGVFSYSADISQWLIERDNHKEQAKRLLGITDSFLGQADNTAKSGYAKSVQVAQSAGRIASKKLLKQAHYADIFRIFFELYLAFADEPRQLHHDDADCMLAAEERFDRNDFYEFDYKTGKWYIDDNYTFSVDQNGAIEQQYPQLWEIVKADFASGMYGDTSDINTQIFAWQHLEKLKYPSAKYVVEMKKQQRERMIAAQQQAAQRGTSPLSPATAGASAQEESASGAVPATVNTQGGIM